MPSAAIVIASPSRATTAPETLVRYAGAKIRTRLPTATVLGCVYHVSYARAGGPGPFAWEAWGRRAFTPAELDGARRDLRATRFRRFRYNFLRLNVTPGNLDWFDDYDAVRANARLAASLARE